MLKEYNLTKNSVKVSILMSVFNPVWDYLRQTLDSIQKQSFDEFELIIVNDGCDAECLLQLLEKYSFTYKIICNTVNLGLPRALNAGLRECQGDYIARIDDDDCMDAERLKIQLAFMEEHSKCLSVFSNYDIINGEDEKIGEHVGNHNGDLRKKLLYRGNCLCHSTLFARREVLEQLGGYDEKMTYAQDYDLYLRMLKKGNIYEIPQSLVRFRSVPERIPRNKHILSALLAYYASLKNMDKFDNRIFWSRTIGTIMGLVKILKI